MRRLALISDLVRSVQRRFDRSAKTARSRMTRVGAALTLAALAAFAAPGAAWAQVVISQVYGGGGIPGAPYNRDFIEIFNRGGTAQNLNGWSVQYAGGSGSTWSVAANLSGVIQPGQYMLIAVGGSGADGAALPSLDYSTIAISMATNAGKVLIASTTTAQNTICPSGAAIEDLVAYGATNCADGNAAAPAPSATTSVQRTPVCSDTNVNAADFALGAPNPRNSQSSVTVCVAPPSLPELSVGDAILKEGASGQTNMSFLVVLSAPAPGDVVFNALAVADTASNDDFLAAAFNGVTIPTGSTSTTVNVPINGDTTVEPDETFFLNVSGQTGALLGDGQGQGTIKNDDQTVAFLNAPPAEVRVGDSPFGLLANATSMLPVVLSIDPASAAVCEIDATDSIVPIGVGTCVVRADQPGDSDYDPAPTAQVSFQVLASNVSNLSALTLSAGTPTPAFAPDVYAYTVSVANSVSSITVTPTAFSAVQVIEVEGSVVPSGTASSPILLAVGDNTIQIVSTAQSGAQSTYVLTVQRAAPGALAITTPNLPRATTNQPYAQTFTASGGTPPVSFALTGGTLPPGLTLTSQGELTGTPNTPGQYTITVTATDAASPGSVGKNFTMFVADPLVLQPAALAQAWVGQGYNQAPLTPAGGIAPFSYAVTGGSLPPGLSLDPQTGGFFGSATTPGTYAFTITATDSGAGFVTFTDSESYSIEVIDASSSNLTALSLSAGALAPAFDPGVTAYTADVPNAVDSITVNATGTPNSTVEVNGVALTPGQPSGPIALDVGPNTITVTTISLDGSVGSTTTIVITRAATPLVAADLSVTTAQNTGVAIPLNQGGGVVNGIAIIGQPANGILSSPFADFTIVVYTPNQGFTGTDSFTYQLIGAGESSNIGAVNITVTPSAPVAADATITVTDFVNPVSVDLTPASGGPATSIEILTGPSTGTLFVTGNAPLQIDYLPAFAFSGTDSFTYRLIGPGGPSNSATVTVAAASPTAAPVSTTVPYDSPGQAIAMAVGGFVTSVTPSAPSSGTATATGPTTITYTPAAGFIGTATFSYTATGPSGTSAPATVTVTVSPPPAPTLTPPAPVATATGGGPTVVDLAPLGAGVVTSFKIVDQPDFGTAEITVGANDQPQLTYTPNAGFIGQDQVSIVATGPGGDSQPAVIVFTVAGKAPDLTGQVASNGSITFQPTAGLSGGPFQGLKITTPPAFGTAQVQGLGIVFTPGLANGGTATIGYVIVTASGDSAPGVITVTTNLAPQPQALTATTAAGTPVTVRVSDGIVGGPLTAVAIVSVSPASAGTATVQAGPAGVFDVTFAPAGAFTGQAVVTFSTTNAFATTDSTLTVTVQPRPDPSADPDVRGIAGSQSQSAKRFADAQITNVQQRLQSLHDGSNESVSNLNLAIGFGRGGSTAGERSPFDRTDRLDRPAFSAEDLSTPRTRAMLASRSDERPGDEALAAFDGPAAGASGGRPRGPFGVWAAGTVNWGRMDASGARDHRFTTQGVTFGVDARVTDALTLGAAAGLGADRTKVGDNGSRSDGDSVSGALYGSWRPGGEWYVDGLIGFGELSFDTRRYAAGTGGAPGVYALGSRSGDLRFGSATFGKLLGAGMAGGPTRDLYLRVDARRIVLDAFTETGAGAANLTWAETTQDSLSANLGAAFGWTADLRDDGLLATTLRVEWSHEFEDMADQGVRYADWAASPLYLVPQDAWSRNDLRLNFGTEWSLDAWTIGLGYRGAFGSAGRSHGAEATIRIGW